MKEDRYDLVQITLRHDGRVQQIPSYQTSSELLR